MCSSVLTGCKVFTNHLHWFWRHLPQQVTTFVSLSLWCPALHPAACTFNLQRPFNITKAGPARVKPDTPFVWNLTVTMLGAATGVKIVDELPSGLLPSGIANWTATAPAGVTQGGDWPNSLVKLALFVAVRLRCGGLFFKKKFFELNCLLQLQVSIQIFPLHHTFKARCSGPMSAAVWAGCTHPADHPARGNQHVRAPATSHKYDHEAKSCQQH
jgi:hypothetical protein